MTTPRPILLVEDNDMDAELTLRALAAESLASRVLRVRDGAHALDFLYCRNAFAKREPGHPVVVLLDLNMPRMGGLEVLRQIKGDPELKAIPVVVMASSREKGDLIETYKAGVNAYVVKPLEFDELMSAVRRVGAFWAALNEPPPEETARS